MDISKYSYTLKDDFLDSYYHIKSSFSNLRIITSISTLLLFIIYIIIDYKYGLNIEGFFYKIPLFTIALIWILKNLKNSLFVPSYKSYLLINDSHNIKEFLNKEMQFNLSHEGIFFIDDNSSIFMFFDDFKKIIEKDNYLFFKSLNYENFIDKSVLSKSDIDTIKSNVKEYINLNIN